MANDVQMPLVPATLGSFTPGGFVAVDNTNLPGWYELGIENAALDGGNEVAIMLKGAANMAPVNIYIELDSVNYQDATAFGLSRLDQTVSSRMETYTQPTGFLTATFPETVASTTNITAASGITLAAVTHTGATIPTVTLVNQLAQTAMSVNDAFLEVVPLVWEQSINDAWSNNSFGERVLISNTDQRRVAVTGSHHVASVLHDAEPNSIPEDAFVTGALSARVLAADAATEIATAVGTLQVLVRLDSMIESDGAGQFRFDTIAVSLAGGGGGGGTGTGARTVNVTVQLSGAPVQGAKVRLTKAGETYLGTTNVSGIATFNIDDGSWIVSITSPNTTFAGAVLAVAGTVNQTYSLTAIAITPSSPGNVTGYWLVLGANGLPETGVTMSMQAVSTEHGSTGLAIDTATRTAVSDAVGVAQFSDLTPGVRYQAWRGTGAKVYVTIPADSDPIVELNSLLGSP
jgi:hypothetical protein